MAKRFVVKHIFIILLLIMSSISLFGQKITASYKNIPLSKVLTSIATDYKITFAFDNALLEKIIINKTFSNVPIDEVIKSLLAETNLMVSKNAEVYMIIPDKKKEATSQPVVFIEPKKPACQITGVVKDSKTGEQLPFATVFISGTNIATSTNNTGFFNLIANACDSMEITVNYIGYKPIRMRVPAQNTPHMVTIMVETEITDLKEIVLEKKNEVLDNSNLSDPTKIKLNTAKMAELPSISENDISAPLQLMPGIDGSTETSSGFLIRKSQADKNLILFDGFSIYQIDHFFGSFSSLNNKAIKDIQVYKSGYDARYGGRTGGFLEITGKSGNMNKPVIDAGIDMLSADASIELPIVKNKLSIIVASRRSFTDYLQTPLYLTLFNNVRYDMEQYYRKYPKAFQSSSEDPVFMFSDLHSKITFKAKENQVFSLSYFSSLDQLHFDQNYQFPAVHENEKWGTQGFSVRYTGNITSKWQQDIVLGSSETQNNYNHSDTSLHDYKIRRFSFTDTISKYDIVNNRIVDNAFAYSNTLQFQQNHTLQFGVTANSIHSDFFSSMGVSSLFVNKSDTTHNYDKQAFVTCPYFQYIYDNRKYMLETGIRLNHYSLTQKNYPELRIQSSLKLSEKVLLKASLGNYHQFVNKLHLSKSQDYQSAWVISDGNIFPVVSSRNIMLGFNYKVTSSLNIDIEMYHRKTDDLTSIFTYFKRDANNKIAQVRKYLYGSNTLNGMDLMLRKTFSNYNVWLAYTLSKSTMQTKRVNNDVTYDAIDDQPHELKLFNTLKVKNWKLSFAIIWGSGKTWQEVTLEQNKKLSLVVNRLPSYFRTDAGVSYNKKFKWLTFSSGINIFNVFDNKNLKIITQKLSDNLSEKIATNQSIFVTSDVYGLGFAPNIYLDFKF
jgi:ferric enterobactin receptor